MPFYSEKLCCETTSVSACQETSREKERARRYESDLDGRATIFVCSDLPRPR